MSESFGEIINSFEDTGQKGLFDQRKDSRIGALDVFAARKIGSGLEALLVQAEPTWLPCIEDWPRSEGFHVEIRPSEGKSGTALVCLELSAPEFREVFLSLGEDICRVLQQESEPEEAICAMHRRLFRWQEFLRKHRPDGLTEEARAGLFGELEVLRSLFLDILEDSKAVAGWRGCKGAHQDFQYPDFALEVKTTRAVTPDRIHISNVRQLDDEGISMMYLYLILVDQNESTGVSLPGIVEDVRSRLNGYALDLFNEGLIEVGYLDTHAELYAATLYRVKEVRALSVTGEFPRLRREAVPEGVKGVKYQIDVDACKPYLIEHNEVVTAVQNLKDGDKS